MADTLFRYPGSKAKLLKTMTPYLDSLVSDKDTFCDAFVGGGSVLLYMAKTYPNLKLRANDLDPYVSAFWSVISNGTDEEIAILKLILKRKPTVDLYYALRMAKLETPETQIDLAYRAIFFNRTSFSGDMRRSASPIGGKNQFSQYKIDCRYNAEKLCQKVDSIRSLIRDRLEVSYLDILDLPEWDNSSTAMYLDPPYYVAGKMLYEKGMKKEAHQEMAQRLQKRDSWLLSYDAAPEITDLYSWADVQHIDVKYCIKGKKLSWNETRELLISPKKNLATTDTV